MGTCTVISDSPLRELTTGKLSTSAVHVCCPITWTQSLVFLNNNSNNNYRSIMVKTNHSTLHKVYNIQQSAMQGSNDMTHRMSHRTAATTRFSREGIGCQK